ncbi:hypothetical protein BI198_07165 [Rheinheimera salexigens]|uniref:DUF2919 domain-containing protein n=2 Tax=Rheinheimera salexigens TaxID=1628148 RepID=A0A1E7QAE7_9GAMM|nr:hypothetical protein BI198_07165 [Rheinheimera salexigens]
MRLYWLLLLLLRPYISWVLVLTLPESQRDILSLIYPLQFDFIIACAIASPLLLILAAISQRKPKGQAWWFQVWRHSRIILLLVAIIDLLLTIKHLPDQVMLDAPWRILAPIAISVGILWLMRSRTLGLVFAEWPTAEDKKKTANK